MVTAAGRIEDTDRVMYLRNHLDASASRRGGGLPGEGLLPVEPDGQLRVGDGYSKRFGIHYVDFRTEKRTPKLSAEWYREVIARNAVV